MTQPTQPAQGVGQYPFNASNSYDTPQGAVDATFGPGWVIKGSEPEYADIPSAVDPSRKDRTIIAWTISAVGPDGTPDKIKVTVVPGSGATGGPKYIVMTGPTNKPPTPVQTSPGETTWITNPADPTGNTQIGGRIINGVWTPNTVGGQPQVRQTPAVETPTPRPTAAIGDWDKLNANGEPVKPGERPVILRDPKTNATINLTQNRGQLVQFGDSLLRVEDDGSYSVVTTKTPDKKGTTLTQGPDGGVYEYDPNKPEGSRLTQVMKPEDKPSVTGTGPNDKFTIVLDKNGNEVARRPNPNYRGAGVSITGTGPTDQFTTVFNNETGEVIDQYPNKNYTQPKGTALTPDTTAPFVPILKPDGTIDYQPNKNQILAGDAMEGLLGQLGVQVKKGSLTLDAAKALLTGAVQTMTNTISAATGALNYTSETARTGAGLLQQRAQTAQGMLGQVLNLAGSGTGSAGKYGQLGGGLHSVPAGLGEQLVGGIQGWTTDLLGGPDTMATAARLVQYADPNNPSSVLAHNGAAALNQMLERALQLKGGQLQGAAVGNPPPGGGAPPVQTMPQPAPQPQPFPAPTTQPGQTIPIPNAGLPDTTINPNQIYMPAGNSGYAYLQSPWNAQPGPAIPNFTAPVTRY